MGWIKQVVARVAAWFGRGRAEAALNTAADYVLRALPIIDIVATIVTGLTPTTIDDAALRLLREKFPALFDGSLKTADELKLYALGAATEVLKHRYPALSTSIARTAVQLAYTAERA